VTEKADRRLLLNAIAEALASGAKNKSALARVRLSVSRGSIPTAAQLRLVNETRERVQLTRVSVPVYDKQRIKKRWELWKQETNDKQRDLQSSRPLAPPRRIES
jgi:hypothetical protein